MSQDVEKTQVSDCTSSTVLRYNMYLAHIFIQLTYFCSIFGYIFLQETLFLKLIGDLLNRIYINYVNFPVLSGTDESL